MAMPRKAPTSPVRLRTTSSSSSSSEGGTSWMRVGHAFTGRQHNDQREHQCPEDLGRPAENTDYQRCFQGNVHWLFVRPRLFSAAWNDWNCSQIASFFCSKFARAASNEGRRSSPRLFHWPANAAKAASVVRMPALARWERKKRDD